MADIVHGEKLKKIFRMLLKLGLKFSGRDMQMIGNDLKYNQNPVIKNLHTLLLVSAGHLHQRDDWQKRTMTEYGQSLLWMVSKDTAYRDPFFWMIDKALEHPEEFKKILAPYVKPPEEWIANQWEASREKSKRLKDTGQIAKHQKSLEETMFTPGIQEKRHKKYLKNRK